jgi:hypothetical protein
MWEDWNTHACVCLRVLRDKRDMWWATQGRPADELFWLLKKGDFIHHLFWNSFPWEVNSFPELQNIKELEDVYCFGEQILIFVPCKSSVDGWTSEFFQLPWHMNNLFLDTGSWLSGVVCCQVQARQLVATNIGSGSTVNAQILQSKN